MPNIDLGPLLVALVVLAGVTFLLGIAIGHWLL